MNRFQHDNLSPELTAKEREARLKRRLGGPGTVKKLKRKERKGKR